MPARAVDPSEPGFGAFADAIAGVVPADARPTLAAATQLDPTGDGYHPSGLEPATRPAEADLAFVASFRLELTPDAARALTASGGLLHCATAGTICSPDRRVPESSASFVVLAGSTRSPLAPAAGRRAEFGVTAFDESPRDGRAAEPWEPIEEFPGDYFAGSNLAWALLSEDGGPYVLRRLEYGPGDAGFLAAPTGAVAILRDGAWAILVPEDEWDGVQSTRSYVFLASIDDPAFSPATAVVDTAPDIDAPARTTSATPTISSDGLGSDAASGRWVLVGVVGLALALVAGSVAAVIARRRR
jgi:hypothetical protein